VVNKEIRDNVFTVHEKLFDELCINKTITKAFITAKYAITDPINWELRKCMRAPVEINLENEFAKE